MAIKEVFVGNNLNTRGYFEQIYQNFQSEFIDIYHHLPLRTALRKQTCAEVELERNSAS